MCAELMKQFYNVAMFVLGCFLSYRLGKEVMYGEMMAKLIIDVKKKIDSKDNEEDEEC